MQWGIAYHAHRILLPLKHLLAAHLLLTRVNTALAFVPSKRTWKRLCIYRSGQLAASLLHGAAQDPLLPSAGHTAAHNPWLALWGAALSYISSSNSLLVSVVGHSRSARCSAGSQHCHPPTQLFNINFTINLFCAVTWGIFMYSSFSCFFLNCESCVLYLWLYSAFNKCLSAAWCQLSLLMVPFVSN